MEIRENVLLTDLLEHEINLDQLGHWLYTRYLITW